MIAICLAVIIVTLSILYSYITRVKYIVPGPPKWPVFGCLFQLELKYIHHCFDRWAKQYGPIFFCKLPGTNIVVINCPRLIKKAFAEKGYSDIFNDRPDSFFGKYVMGGFKGVLFGKYEQNYIRLRKMMHKGLNMYGAGIQFEKIAHSELVAVIKTISDLEGKDLDPKELLTRSLASQIGTLLTGSVVDENDVDLIWKYTNNLIDVLERSTEIILHAFPFLRFMPVEVGRRYRRTLKSRNELLDKYFSSHKETYVSGHERGLIDALFKLQSQEKSDVETQWLTDSQVMAFIQDIINSSLLTTRNCLLCILLVLLHHHDCVDKIYQEIVEVVGLERSPSLSDTPAMPYTEALILEALRYLTHIPLPLPHGALEDVKFEGYFIPKGSMIFANLWTVHHDPAIWGDPWVFRPERFIDVNGKLLPVEHTLRQSLLTFGIGKRSCIGENLARSRIFLYLTTLVQKFDLRLPKVGTVPSEDPRTFIPEAIMLPQDYKMRFIVR